jgi:hypothetical protein
MQIRLIKIEEGLLKGSVYYNRIIQKTGEEIA